MYEVLVEAPFSAAHHLEDYEGRCASVHGHRWKVRLIVRGERTDAEGKLLPAGDLRRLLESLLQRFSGADLNRDPIFAGDNPSAENLASWIHRALRTAPLIARRDPPVRLHVVEVEETPGSVARHLDDGEWD
jgi:6-pyruvoyltetrahydropterin/6-carboxytetrahydropterin synthase